MSDDWDVPDPEDEDLIYLPDLNTPSGREEWVDIIVDQNDEDIEERGGWTKALMVANEDYLVVRFRDSDGSEEVMTCQIEKKMTIVRGGDPAERN